MPNVAEIIREHVTLDVKCVDRAYVPQISGAISSEFLSGPSLAIVGFGLDELERLGLPGA
jgi:hypothetical protein